MRLAVIGLAGVLLGLGTTSVLHAEDRVRVVERLPKTPTLDSGRLPLSALSDRQLVALLVDLTHRSQHDRDCHGGNPGPDAEYLKAWTDKVIAEMDTRKMTADKDGLIDIPVEK